MYTLPTEIFHEVFGFLSVHDLCSVRFLNKYLNNVVEGYLRPKLMWESEITEKEISKFVEYNYIHPRIGSMLESQTKTDINQLIDIIRTRTESGLTFPTIFTSFHFHLHYTTLDQCEEFANIYGEYVERFYFSTIKTDGDQDKVQVLLNNSQNTKYKTNQNNDEICLNSTPQQEGIFLEIDTSVSVQLLQSMLTTTRAIKSVKLNIRLESCLLDLDGNLILVPEVLKLSSAIKIFHFRYGSVGYEKPFFDFAASKQIEIESLTMTHTGYGMAHFNDFIHHFSNKLSKLNIQFLGDGSKHVTIPYLPNLTYLRIHVFENVFVKQFVLGQFPKLKELRLRIRGISEQLDVLHNLNLEYLSLQYNSYIYCPETPVQSDFDKLYAFLESQSQTLKVLYLECQCLFQCPSMKALEYWQMVFPPLFNSSDFPSLRLVSLHTLVLHDELFNKDKVLPNVTGLELVGLCSRKIPLHTIKVFPNLTKLELSIELQHDLEFIFTRMFTLKELSILCTRHEEIDGLWEALTGFDKSKEIDGKENIYGPSLEDMHALECLRIKEPSLTFLDALEYMAKTNRMKKLSHLCLDNLPSDSDWLYFTEFLSQFRTVPLKVQNIVRTLKTYHQQVLEQMLAL